MEYTLIRERRDNGKYLQRLTLIDRNYWTYLREKERRRMHWSSKVYCS